MYLSFIDDITPPINKIFAISRRQIVELYDEKGERCHERDECVSRPRSDNVGVRTSAVCEVISVTVRPGPVTEIQGRSLAALPQHRPPDGVQIDLEGVPVCDEVGTQRPRAVIVLLQRDTVNIAKTTEERSIKRPPVLGDQQHKRSCWANPIDVPDIAENNGCRMRSIVAVGQAVQDIEVSSLEMRVAESGEDGIIRDGVGTDDLDRIERHN
jgi:hypothetical protein